MYVRGEGFSDVPSDNALVLGDERARPLCDARALPDCIPGNVLDGAHALRFAIPVGTYHGGTMLRVRVGDSVSQGDSRR